MTIQELFSSKPIIEIEEQILDHFPDTAKRPLKPDTKRVIEELLKVRKRLLDEHFSLNEKSRALIRDFNEAIKSELLRMRIEAIKMHEAILQLYPEKADRGLSLLLRYQRVFGRQMSILPISLKRELQCAMGICVLLSLLSASRRNYKLSIP